MLNTIGSFNSIQNSPIDYLKFPLVFLYILFITL